MILATSPVYFRGHGLALRRAVLKIDNGNKFVVHDQYIHSDGSSTFGNGSYFPFFHYQNNNTSGGKEAFQKAHASFLKRCDEYAKRTCGEEATDRLASPTELESMQTFLTLANQE